MNDPASDGARPRMRYASPRLALLWAVRILMRATGRKPAEISEDEWDRAEAEVVARGIERVSPRLLGFEIRCQTWTGRDITLGPLMVAAGYVEARLAHPAEPAPPPPSLRERLFGSREERLGRALATVFAAKQDDLAAALRRIKLDRPTFPAEHRLDDHVPEMRLARRALAALYANFASGEIESLDSEAGADFMGRRSPPEETPEPATNPQP